MPAVRPWYPLERYGSPAAGGAPFMIRGRVQGVGYRDFAQRAAAELGLKGFVYVWRALVVLLMPPRREDDGLVAAIEACGCPAPVS